MALALAASCLLVVGAALSAAWWYRAPLVEVGRGGSFVDHIVLPGLARWVARPRGAGEAGVLVYGDSLAACPAGVRVSAVIESALRARGVDAQVGEVVHRAFRPLQFYYLLDEVLAGAPRAVVFEVDLRALSPGFVLNDGSHFRNLSRKLSPARALRMAAVLAHDGVSLLDPPVYRLEERLGLLYVPSGLRDLGRGQLERLGDAIRTATGLAGPNAVERLARTVEPLLVPTAERLRGEYVFDQGSRLQLSVLRAMVEELRRRAVAALVYVSPVDVGLLARLGLTEELGLPARVAAMRTDVGATEAEWLDLHAAAPADAFRDDANHLEPPGCELVGQAVAARLAARMR